MESVSRTSILRLVRPLAFAASFVLAILVFCCRGDNSFMLYFNLYGAMDELIASFGLGALVCCVLLIVAPSESKRARAVWISLSTAACLAGLIAALMGDPASAVQVALASGALLGLGTIGLIGQWCCVFAQLPQRVIPFTIALSFFFGTLLWFVLQIVDDFKITCIALIVFSLCGGLLLALTIPASRSGKSASERDLVLSRYQPTGSSDSETESSESSPYRPSVAPQSSPPSTANDANDESISKTETDLQEKAGASVSPKPIKVRPAITLIDGFTMNPFPSVSWAHAFEALGGILVSFFILGIMYWPDAVDVVQTRALLKPLGYALASIVVFVASARGSVSSLASGGMDRLRRNIIIAASLLVIVSVLLLPTTTAGAHEALRLVNNFALAVLMLFGIISSFIHILRHDPSPTFACAITVLCGGIGLSFGILAFLLLGNAAYIAGACVTAVYFIVLVVFSILDRDAPLRATS